MADKRGKKPKTGPEPERVKIEGDWKVAVGQALAKPVPEGGWPKPESRYKARVKPQARRKK